MICLREICVIVLSSETNSREIFVKVFLAQLQF